MKHVMITLLCATCLLMAGALVAQETPPPAEAAPAPPPAEAAPAPPPAEAAPAPPPAEAAPAPPPAEAAPAPPPAEAAPPPPPAPATLTDIKQVQIQVWISETNEQGLRDIGANLDFTRFVRGEEQSGSLQQISTNVARFGDSFPQVTLPAPDQSQFDPPLRTDENAIAADGIQTRIGFGLEASIISPGYGTVEGVFRAAERKADVDLISKPELLVVNGGTATIQAGGQVPFQDVSYDPKGLLQLGVKWQDIGVTMDIQPLVLPNDFVQLNLTKLEVSDVPRIENLRGVDLPVFSKRAQTGQVLVPNTQTLVIGGLSSRVVRKTERRVPIVGKVPILGIPFRSRKSEADITTLLIFVSPTIVDLRNMTDRSVNALHFWRERGGEWVNADRIEQELESMRDEL
jgi:type II secretory pathway component GspD/PulD (secretin)